MVEFGQDQSVVIFRVGDHVFCVPALEVTAIVQPPAMTKLPLAAPYVLGTFLFRGNVATAVSLKRLLGIDAEPARAVVQLIVAEINGEMAAFSVDTVEDVTEARKLSWRESADGQNDKIIERFALRGEQILLFTHFDRLLRARDNGQQLRKLSAHAAALHDETETRASVDALAPAPIAAPPAAMSNKASLPEETTSGIAEDNTRQSPDTPRSASDDGDPAPHITESAQPQKSHVASVIENGNVSARDVDQPENLADAPPATTSAVTTLELPHQALREYSDDAKIVGAVTGSVIAASNTQGTIDPSDIADVATRSTRQDKTEQILCTEDDGLKEERREWHGEAFFPKTIHTEKGANVELSESDLRQISASLVHQTMEVGPILPTSNDVRSNPAFDPVDIEPLVAFDPAHQQDAREQSLNDANIRANDKAKEQSRVMGKSERLIIDDFAPAPSSGIQYDHPPPQPRRVGPTFVYVSSVLVVIAAAAAGVGFMGAGNSGGSAADDLAGARPTATIVIPPNRVGTQYVKDRVDVNESKVPAATHRVLEVKAEKFTLIVDRPIGVNSHPPSVMDIGRGVEHSKIPRANKTSAQQGAHDAVPAANGASAPPDVITANTMTHVVVQGDTLWDIAENYLGDPYRYPELAHTNEIRDPDTIYPNDIVRLYKH